MQWLLSKLASQLKLAKLESESSEDMSKNESSSTFKENILLEEEERMIIDATGYVALFCHWLLLYAFC